MDQVDPVSFPKDIQKTYWWSGVGKSRKLQMTPPWIFSPERNPECTYAEKDDRFPRDKKAEHSREDLAGQTAPGNQDIENSTEMEPCFCL